MKADMICRKENGQLITSDSFKYCSRIIRNELNIPFKYHALRHTHATILTENGANIKTVQQMLGHSDISTTQVYSFASNSKNLTEAYKNSHPRA